MTGTKTFDVHTQYGTEKGCTFSVGRYVNNDHIAISIWCEDGPFANLTVNLRGLSRYPKNFGYVDTNNYSQGPELIERLGIGKWTGELGVSGRCTYPLYEFDEAAVHDYAA